jgi:hypothetical protein
VEPLPPDIDTALRIDSRKAGITPAFLVWMPEPPAPHLPCDMRFESVKKFSRCTQLFVMMRYYEFQPAGLDIKTCVLLR